MSLNLDEDVLAVLVFMQGRMVASKLVAVASGVSALASILWGEYPAEPFRALALSAMPKPPSAIE